MSDFFGSHAPRDFPSSLSRSRDALVLLPEGFPLLSLDLVQRERWRSLWLCVSVRELASVSSVHSWTGDPGVALLRRTPATCFVPVGSPKSSLHARRGVGGRIFGGFCSVLGCLFRLIPPLARWWGGRPCREPLQLGSSLASRSSAWETGRVL